MRWLWVVALSLWLPLAAKAQRLPYLTRSFGFDLGVYSHLSGLESKRFSQQARLQGFDFESGISLDLRFIRLSRSGFVGTDPAWGLGVGARYFFVTPSPGGNSLESGNLLSAGAGLYHYFVGDSRYPIDPFFEFTFDRLVPVSEETAFLFGVSVGAYPYLLKSSYLSWAPWVHRLRMRLGAHLGFVFDAQ